MTCCLSIQHGRSDSYVWYTFGVGRPWLALIQEARLSFLYHTLLTYLSLPEALFSHLADNGLVKVVLWDQVPGSLVFRHSCVSISRHSFYLLSQTRGKTQTMCNFCAQNVSICVTLKTTFMSCDCTSSKCVGPYVMLKSSYRFHYFYSVRSATYPVMFRGVFICFGLFFVFAEWLIRPTVDVLG